MLNNTQASDADPASVRVFHWVYLDLRNYTSTWTFMQDLNSLHGEILCKSQFQSPLSLPKNKQPNLAFLSGRLTSSSDLALSHSFSVQRSLFHGDVIAITSWAPDVNLVRPYQRHKR